MRESLSENLERQEIPSREEGLYMKKTILIEEELIEESELEPEEWIKKYGERFRKIVSEKPELLKDKEKLKKELEKEITH